MAAWAWQRPDGAERGEALPWGNLLGTPCPRVVNHALAAKAMPTQGPPQLGRLPADRTLFDFGDVLLLGCWLPDTREAPVAPWGTKHSVVRVCTRCFDVSPSLGRRILVCIWVLLSELSYWRALLRSDLGHSDCMLAVRGRDTFLRWSWMPSLPYTDTGQATLVGDDAGWLRGCARETCPAHLTLRHIRTMQARRSLRIIACVGMQVAAILRGAYR